MKKKPSVIAKDVASRIESKNADNFDRPARRSQNSAQRKYQEHQE